MIDCRSVNLHKSLLFNQTDGAGATSLTIIHLNATELHFRNSTIK